MDLVPTEIATVRPAYHGTGIEHLDTCSLAEVVIDVKSWSPVYFRVTGGWPAGAVENVDV